jgi:hypothetical protein
MGRASELESGPPAYGPHPVDRTGARVISTRGVSKFTAFKRREIEWGAERRAACGYPSPVTGSFHETP